MKYEIEIDQHALKVLQKIPKTDQKRIINAIADLFKPKTYWRKKTCWTRWFSN